MADDVPEVPLDASPLRPEEQSFFEADAEERASMRATRDKVHATREKVKRQPIVSDAEAGEE